MQPAAAAAAGGAAAAAAAEDTLAASRQQQQHLHLASLPAPPQMAWKSSKDGAAQGRHEELRRSTQGLLNRICPGNIKTIARRIIELKISSTREMELVIELIFKKVLLEKKLLRDIC